MSGSSQGSSSSSAAPVKGFSSNSGYHDGFQYGSNCGYDSGFADGSSYSSYKYSYSALYEYYLSNAQLNNFINPKQYITDFKRGYAEGFAAGYDQGYNEGKAYINSQSMSSSLGLTNGSKTATGSSYNDCSQYRLFRIEEDTPTYPPTYIITMWNPDYNACVGRHVPFGIDDKIYSIDDINTGLQMGKLIEETDATQEKIGIFLREKSNEFRRSRPNKYRPYEGCDINNILADDDNSVGLIDLSIVHNDNFLNEIILNFPGKSYEICQAHFEQMYNEGKEEIIVDEKSVVGFAETRLRDLSDLISEKNLTPIYEVYNFLRCYIDMFHDFLGEGIKIKDYLKSNYITYINSIGYPAELVGHCNQLLNEIDQYVITAGDNISQIKCRIKMEEIVDEYIEQLHLNGINNIPKMKGQSIKASPVIVPDKKRMTQEELDETTINFNSFARALASKGVNHFFVESASSSIGIELSSRNFTNISLPISDWDAGTGYKGDAKNQLVINAPQITNPPINIYGIYNILADNDNTTLVVKDITTNKVLAIKPLQKLSLNLVAFNAGLNKIRGTTETSENDVKDEIKTTPVESLSDDIKRSLGLDINTSLGPKIETVSDPNSRSLMLCSLKTWTDLIQIRAISALKGVKDPIAVVISDGLCESTARMHGLSHVLRNDGRKITYYSYDINAVGLTPEQQTKRFFVMNYFKKYFDSFFYQYIYKFFTNRLNVLQNMLTITEDPSLYYTIKIYIDIYNKNGEKALQNLQVLSESTKLEDFPETVHELIEGLTLGERTVESFENDVISFRESAAGFQTFTKTNFKGFVDIYTKIRQKVIDTANLPDENQIGIHVALVMTYYLLQKQSKGDLNVTLDSVLGYIATEYATEPDFVNNISRDIEILRAIYTDVEKDDTYKSYLQGIVNYSTNIKYELKAEPKDLLPEFSFYEMINKYARQEGGRRKKRSLFRGKTRKAARRQLKHASYKKHNKMHGKTRRMSNRLKRASTRRRKTSRRK